MRWRIEVGEPIQPQATHSDGYQEVAAAVLPTDSMLYVRTVDGVVAVRKPAGQRPAYQDPAGMAGPFTLAQPRGHRAGRAGLASTRPVHKAVRFHPLRL